MPGERGVDRDLGGFGVADFADHDHVGVLAQNRSQSVGESQVDFRIDLHLADAMELVLDRILDRDDVLFGRIDLLQTGVKRGRLARSGGPGDQNDAVALADQAVEPAQVLAAESQPIQFQIDQILRLIEQPQHDTFAEGGGNYGYANVDVAARDPQPDPPILRQPLLGDVQAGHDLDTGSYRRLDVFGRIDHVVEHPVNPEPDHQVALERLDMNVAGAILHRLRQQSVDQLDNRRGVVGFEQVLGLLRQLAGHHVEPLFAQVDHQVMGRAGGLIVGAIDGLVDDFGGRDDGLNRLSEQKAQIVERLEVSGVCNRNCDAMAVGAKGQQRVLFGVVYRDFKNQVGVEGMLVDMGLKRQAILLGQSAGQALRLQRAHLDQRRGQFLTGL